MNAFAVAWTRRQSTSSVLVPVAAVIALLLGLVAVLPAGAAIDAQDFLVGDDPAEFTPNVLDGEVYTIAQVGDMIVAGGDFNQVQDADGGPILDQANLFAFDRRTGEIDTGFRPTVNNRVEAVVAASGGDEVYVGGWFSDVNGTGRGRVVKMDVDDGSIDLGFRAQADSRVNEVILSGDRLFVGGNFDRINSVDRDLIAELDPQTGDVRGSFDHVFAAPYGGRDGSGSLSVRAFDVSPDGSRLVAVGNFGTVDGQDRQSIVQFDLTADPSSLFDWRTTRYGQSACFSAFDTYMRDVQISPDGAYFVVATTGGGVRGTLCDTAARWSLAATGDDVREEWENSTGGDTLWSAGLTGEVVYVGGHQRWLNNPTGSDFAGPGAVSREGIAALDPRNGLPFTWNPGRTRGIGLFDFVANEQGLFASSDTETWAGETHGRVALFPADDGGPVPDDAPGPIPGTMLQATASARNPGYLHRVNAGGGALAAVDDGMDWMADTGTFRNGGSNAAGYGTVPTVTGAVPSSTPRAIYSSERWDPGAAPEMSWDFPVEAGREVEVRLYLSNRCTCTSSAGQRVFDVSIDGETRLDDLDMVQRYGHDVGGVETFTVVSDGNIDLDWTHVVENPLVNGIEIVDPALVDQQLAPTAPLELTTFDGSSASDPTQVTGGPDFDQARGAWMLSGTLFNGWADGTLTRRTFDGSTFGPAEQIDLNGLGNAQFPVSSISGATFDPITGRLYYTVTGSNALYHRGFQPESGIVGAVEYVATGPVAGVDWGQVAGLHLDVASDRLFYGSTDGNLRSVTYVDGVVSGSPTQVSGPDSDDGLTWSGRGLTAYAGEDVVLPNQQPTANLVVDCDDERTCTFTATGSEDVDGQLVAYDWDFGDGETATGASTSHTFGEGAFTTRLTVTDDDGASGTATQELVFSGAPEAVIDASCIGLSCTFDGTGSSDGGDPVVAHDWDLGDGTTSDQPMVDHDYEVPGTYTVGLTVTDDEGETASTTREVVVDELDESISFVDSTSLDGQFTSFGVVVPQDVQPGDLLLLTVASSRPGIGDEPPTGVTGWDRVDTIAVKNLTSTVWTQVADGSEAGETVTVTMEGVSTKAVVSLAAYRGVDPDQPFLVSEGVGETSTTASHTTPTGSVGTEGAWVVSYWNDRTSGTTAWTPPAGVTVREEGYTPAGGRATSLLADSGGPVPAGDVGGLTATADSSNVQASMWTFALTPGEFVPPPPPDPIAPTADATGSCDELVCTLDASGSQDPDGDIVSWDWDFGDEAGDSGEVVGHEYAEGTFTATVTVTDDQGLTDTAEVELSPAVTPDGPPEAVIDASCTARSCSFDGTGSNDAGDPVVAHAWDLGDGTTSDQPTVDHDYEGPDTYTVTLTVTDDEGDTATATQDVEVTDEVAPISFVGSTTNAKQDTAFDVDVPADVETGDALLLFVASSRPDIGDEPPTGIVGWDRVDTITNKNLTSTVWSRIADGSEAGQTVQVSMEGVYTKAVVSLAAYRGVHPDQPFLVAGGVAETSNTAAHTTPTSTVGVDGAWVVSYWNDRTSGTTSWTPPPGVTVREQGYTSSGGRATSLVADSGGPVPAGPVGGLTATADSSNSQASMWTFALAPAG